MKEEIIEDTVVAYAESRGWVAKKWATPGSKGTHDHIFFKNGLSFSIEFKAPGKKASPLQRTCAEDLAGALIPSRCVDAVYKGKIFVDAMTNEAKTFRSPAAYQVNTESFL